MKRLLALMLAVMMVVSFAACGKGENAKDGDVPTLVWYVHGDKQQDVASVMEAVNAITVPAIGAKLDLQFIDQPSYTEKMQMMMAAGTEFDICFTGYVNTYKYAAQRGGLLELDEYLKDMPELWNSMPARTWETTRLGGKIYAIPNHQIIGLQLNFYTFKDLADKYGLTDQLEPGERIGKQQIEDYLIKIRDNEPNYYGFRPNYQTTAIKTYDQDEIHKYTESINNVSIRFDENGKLLDMYTGDKYGENLYTAQEARRWYKMGLIREDVASMANDTAEQNAGKYASWIEKWKPGILQELQQKHGREVVSYQVTENIYPSSAPDAMTGISKTSKHPELALKMVELVNTNKELYNLICFGIEGKHYTLDENGRVVFNDQGGYIPKACWKFGNQFNALLLPGQPEDVWEQTMKMNDDAIASPLLGFNFDNTPVTNEIAAISSISAEYSALSKGVEDPEKKFAEAEKRYDEAGRQRILAEFKKQYDEWLKSKK